MQSIIDGGLLDQYTNNGLRKLQAPPSYRGPGMCTGGYGLGDGYLLVPGGDGVPYETWKNWDIVKGKPWDRERDRRLTEGLELLLFGVTEAMLGAALAPETLGVSAIMILHGLDNAYTGMQKLCGKSESTYTAKAAGQHIDDALNRIALIAGIWKAIKSLSEMTNAPAAASPYAHLRPGWTKHIDSVVDDLVASGRPKTVVLGEGGQGKIRSFVNREPAKMTEFLEMRPNSLDYTAQAKAGTLTPAMEAETLDFNLLMIERLQQRGFTFKVIGVDSSAAAKSSWLKAELEVLERLGTKWEVIPPTRVDEVLKLPKWR